MHSINPILTGDGGDSLRLDFKRFKNFSLNWQSSRVLTKCVIIYTSKRWFRVPSPRPTVFPSYFESWQVTGCFAPPVCPPRPCWNKALHINGNLSKSSLGQSESLKKTTDCTADPQNQCKPNQSIHNGISCACVFQVNLSAWTFLRVLSNTQPARDQKSPQVSPRKAQKIWMFKFCRSILTDVFIRFTQSNVKFT